MIAVERTDLPMPLWKARFDALNGLAALELRQDQAVEFAWVDLSTGQLTLCVVPDVPHLTMVEAAHGHMLLQTYPNPSLPLPQGLWALDERGKLAWHAPEHRLAAVLTDGFWLEGETSQFISPAGVPMAAPADHLASSLAYAEVTDQIVRYADLRSADSALPEHEFCPSKSLLPAAAIWADDASATLCFALKSAGQWNPETIFTNVPSGVQPVLIGLGEQWIVGGRGLPLIRIICH